MTGPVRKKLNPEDRLLWSRVTRTVSPLDGRRVPENLEIDQDFEDALAANAAEPRNPPAGRVRPGAPENRAGRPSPLETSTRRKLAKGRVSIESRIDLHDLSQIEAHRMLLLFLQRAHGESLRHVLVITGKGRSPDSEGTLRRAVPMWLATAPFRPLVSGFHEAARHHGGAGALYVRLRRGPQRHGS
jgi:DNA-nicking Smr family endonuclease